MASLQELFRKVRSILNKLTPQKFNQLMKQVTDLTIDTEERLKGVIDLVFEKAIDEPSFSVAYGNMCRCLATVSQSLSRLRCRAVVVLCFKLYRRYIHSKLLLYYVIILLVL